MCGEQKQVLDTAQTLLKPWKQNSSAPEYINLGIKLKV